MIVCSELLDIRYPSRQPGSSSMLSNNFFARAATLVASSYSIGQITGFAAEENFVGEVYLMMDIFVPTGASIVLASHIDIV
jgi:hypothetical protein